MIYFNLKNDKAREIIEQLNNVFPNKFEVTSEVFITFDKDVHGFVSYGKMKLFDNADQETHISLDDIGTIYLV